MVKAAIDIPRQQIVDFCHRNHITKLALFGSVLRDDFGPESDVDVLVCHTQTLKLYFPLF